MKDFDHVVWDWNGTLLDDFDIILEAASASCLPLRGQPLAAAEYRSHFTRPVQTFYERIVGRSISSAEWSELTTRFNQAYLDALDRACLARDAHDALDTVERVGLSQSLLSMWSHDDLVTALQRHGIADRFAVVQGKEVPDTGEDTKAGHLADHLDRLAQAQGRAVVAARVLVVGDTLDDAAAATAVGARCVMVEGGSHDAANLAGAGYPVATSLVHALRLAGLTTGSSQPR